MTNISTSTRGPSAFESTVRDRVLAAFRRIDEVDRPEVWITLRSERDVLEEADSIDLARARGEVLPLAGTLFAVKDNIDAAGLPTTAAAPEFLYRPAKTATAVRRLQKAGAIVLGKTNMDQFATGLVGTRSPYGAVRNAVHSDRISGGSSSGSAVAVALGIVDFSLGTDTAGSGRVPAALNGIVGVKATLGLVPTDGVVPASRSYDCVTVFTPTLAAAQKVLRIMTGPSGTDASSRTWPDDIRLSAPRAPRVAVPRPADLEVLTPDGLGAFRTMSDRLESLGCEIAEIDLTPFLQAATLLYGGALVAERYEAFGEFLRTHPDSADSTVASIVLAAGHVTGADLAADQRRVAEFGSVARTALADFDALLLPTTTGHPTIVEALADPITVNARLGTFTNFVNLLDMAAVAVPAGRADGGLFGVSVIVRAFEDQVAFDLGALLTGEVLSDTYPDNGIPLVVFGAHLNGQPLNHQLVSRGARLVGDVATVADYRMHLLRGAVPKPSVVRVAHGEGAEIPGELWLISPAGLGTFLAQLPEPMTLGRVRLTNGADVIGFGSADSSGPDITDLGGWKNYLALQT